MLVILVHCLTSYHVLNDFKIKNIVHHAEMGCFHTLISGLSQPAYCANTTAILNGNPRIAGSKYCHIGKICTNIDQSTTCVRFSVCLSSGSTCTSEVRIQAFVYISGPLKMMMLAPTSAKLQSVMQPTVVSIHQRETLC